jgi:hypothetical protein
VHSLTASKNIPRPDEGGDLSDHLLRLSWKNRVDTLASPHQKKEEGKPQKRIEIQMSGCAEHYSLDHSL